MNDIFREVVEWYWFYDEADDLLTSLRYEKRYNMWGSVTMARRFVLNGQHELEAIAINAWTAFENLQRELKKLESMMDNPNLPF